MFAFIYLSKTQCVKTITNKSKATLFSGGNSTLDAYVYIEKKMCKLCL